MALSFPPLILPLIIDFGIQLVCFVIAAILQTETFYDLSGSLTYLTCFLVSLLVRGDDTPISQVNPRQIIATALSCVWCLRLGYFLFRRALRQPDHRFDEVKTQPLRFSVYWFLQAVWIWLTGFAVFIVNSNSPSTMRPFGGWPSDEIGIAVWAIGFFWEAVADSQKNAFKNAHPKEFMRTGLFRYSRYPNYFGEMTLWLGMFILCMGGFTDGWNWVSAISPVFVVFLIAKVSGIPLLEESSKKRYGDDPEFKKYVAATPFLIPWFPKKNVKVDTLTSQAEL